MNCGQTILRLALWALMMPGYARLLDWMATTLDTGDPTSVLGFLACAFWFLYAGARLIHRIGDFAVDKSSVVE